VETLNRTLETIGRGVGGVVGKIYQAGRDTIEIVLRTVLPFIAFVALMVGIVTGTGIGDLLANTLAPLAGSIGGLLLLSVIIALPVLSPVLGPGAVIAQVIGVPVGLSLGEAEPETVEVGVPAILFSRMVTGPAAVIIAYFASFGLYA
jgi:glucitol/sorbitol PTS system EIIB component